MKCTEKQKQTHLRYYRKHRAKRLAYRRQYYRDHIETEKQKGIAREHLRKYGITVEEKYRKLEEQGGRCAICETEDSGKNDWHTDHNHKTNQVRGIVCGSCNLMLGKAKENPRTLLNAVLYLAKYEGGLIGAPVCK